MNEKIIFKWDREMIENLLEDVFEKVSRQKVNITVHYSNNTKIQINYQKCSYPCDSSDLYYNTVCNIMLNFLCS